MKALTYKVVIRYAEIEGRYFIQDNETGMQEVSEEELLKLPGVEFGEDQTEESINIMAVWLMPYFPVVISSLNKAEVYENGKPVITALCLADNSIVVTCERKLTVDERGILKDLFGENIYTKGETSESNDENVSVGDTVQESDPDLFIESLSPNDSVQESGMDFQEWSDSVVLAGAEPESVEAGETVEQDTVDNIEVPTEQEVVNTEQGNSYRSDPDAGKLQVE